MLAPPGQNTMGQTAPMSRQDSHQITTIAVLLAGITDPMAILAGLQGAVRDSGAEASATDAQANGVRQEGADAARAHSMEQAVAAAEKAMSGMPKWLQKTIGAVLAVVGAVASVVTGGASIALTVIGAILLTAGSVCEFLADKGIGGEAMQYVAMGLKLVGSIVMSCGASAGAAAGDVALKVAAVAADVVKYASAATSCVNGAINIQSSVRNFQATNFRLDAEGHALNSEEVSAEMEQATEHLVATIETHSRAMRRIHSLVELTGQTRAAVHFA
ncbi:MAG: hypothetical protein ACI9KE_004703 [Polyangiales bacterium]|jgi:hypothetical protein